MYRLILETLLAWNWPWTNCVSRPKRRWTGKTFKLDYRHHETVYHINCMNVSGAWKVPPKIFLDAIEQPGAVLKLVNDRREHYVDVKFEL